MQVLQAVLFSPLVLEITLLGYGLFIIHLYHAYSLVLTLICKLPYAVAHNINLCFTFWFMGLYYDYLLFILKTSRKN